MAIKHILVPSDFSQTAKSALTCALSIAKTSSAKITLLHIVTVYNDDPYRDDQPFPSLEEYYEQMEQKADGLFKKETKKIPLKNLIGLLKYEKRNSSRAFKEYLGETIEIAQEIGKREGLLPEDKQIIANLANVINLKELKEKVRKIKNLQIKQFLEKYVLKYIKKKQ